MIRKACADDIIVFDDEFVKGMANTRRIAIDGTEMIEISELFVDPFFQHQGIAGKLMLEIEAQSKLTGICDIFLWVLEKNSEAIHFYERYDFVPTGERKLEEGTSEYILKYAKKIPL